MVNVDSNKDLQYKKPSAGAIIGGVLTGSTVKKLVASPTKIISPKIIEKMSSISKELTADEFSLVEKASQELIEKSGLKEKGVSIIKASAQNSSEIEQIMTQEIDKGILKHFPKQIKKLIGGMFSSQMTSGNNACYAFKAKKIVVPEKELGLAVFHEAGHAMNANLSTIGKTLQASRSLSLLSIPIAAIALFKTKKGPDEKPKNKVDKATTFIKENAGKLTFMTFLPVLIEEGLATLKGNKQAKELLNPDLARKVAKSNALGFSTYLLVAALSGIGMYLGVKVKDAIAKPKPVENKNIDLK